MRDITTLAAYLHLNILDPAIYHAPQYEYMCKREFGLSVDDFCRQAVEQRTVPAFVDRARFVRGVTLSKQFIKGYTASFTDLTIGNSAALMTDGSIAIAARQGKNSKVVHRIFSEDFSKLPTGQICSFLVKEVANSTTEMFVRIIEEAIKTVAARNVTIS